METVTIFNKFHFNTEELLPAATAETKIDKVENISYVTTATTTSKIILENIPKIETDEQNLWSDSESHELDQDPFADVDCDPNFVLCGDPPSDLTVHEQKPEMSTETNLTITDHSLTTSKHTLSTPTPSTTIVQKNSQFFACKLCFTKLGSENDLKSHLKLCSTTHKNRRLFCVDCNIKYGSAHGFKNHNLKVHCRGIEPIRPDHYRVQFKCQFCPLMFVLREKFKIHTESHVKNLELDTAATAQNEANLELKLNPYKCQECGSTFSTVINLSDHVLAKHVDHIFKCPHEKCEKIFTSKGKLNQHFNTHSDERPFQCPEPNCAKRFKFKQHMRGHMTCHSKTKLFICREPNCSSTFRTEDDLKKHKGIHTSGDNDRSDIIKPFACSECHMTFSLNWRLTTHVNLVHRKGDPFKCPQPDCWKTFKYENSLNIHVKGFHGDGETESFKCPHPGCNYTCKQKSYVKVHMRTHTGERPFKCGVVEGCSKTFIKSSYLKRHIREKHMENV